MKAVLLALLATVVGAGMVAGGVYGVIEDVSGDDDSTSASTATPAVSIPQIPSASSGFDECEALRERDARLPELDGRRFKRSGGATGSFQVQLICSGDTAVLSVRASGLREQDTMTYYAWLFRSRRQAKQVGTLIGSSGSAIGSITIGPDKDSRRYDELVITQVPFGEDETRPRKIVFRTPL